MTDEELKAGLIDWFANFAATDAERQEDLNTQLLAFVAANKNAVTLLVADYKLSVIAADKLKKAEQQVHLDSEETKWTEAKGVADVGIE